MATAMQRRRLLRGVGAGVPESMDWVALGALVCSYAFLLERCWEDACTWSGLSCSLITMDKTQTTKQAR